MIGILTGDIINSREVEKPKLWLKPLKKALITFGKSPKHWEIFRGDSFQLEIEDFKNSFEAAVYIKSCMKTEEFDVRIAIGIGKKTHNTRSITEANGEAFIFSGETFETLKKQKRNLAIKTINHKLNEELNLYFQLALIAMDNWTTNSAEIVKLSLENPELSQEELGERIGIKQNTVSERQKRAYLDEIQNLNTLYQKKILQIENL